ncbi:MAG: hypothetical protein CL920_25850 [Deltaproteobacteria bacterium]|nr:hypothetical protein [Deltaproteobacteria bacterium]MBU52131.1 hypothetical protein [Deltaproteobacteria bacterium]
MLLSGLLQQHTITPRHHTPSTCHFETHIHKTNKRNYFLSYRTRSDTFYPPDLQKRSHEYRKTDSPPPT